MSKLKPLGLKSRALCRKQAASCLVSPGTERVGEQRKVCSSFHSGGDKSRHALQTLSLIAAGADGDVTCSPQHRSRRGSGEGLQRHFYFPSSNDPSHETRAVKTGLLSAPSKKTNEPTGNNSVVFLLLPSMTQPVGISNAN